MCSAAAAARILKNTGATVRGASRHRQRRAHIWVLAMITYERPHLRQFDLKSWRQYHMCLQHNSQISNWLNIITLSTGRLLPWQSLCYDQFDERKNEGYDPCSKFNNCPLLSLPLSHTAGGNMCVASYRSFSRCVRRNASP